FAEAESPASKYEDIEIFRRILDEALLKKSLVRVGQAHSNSLAISPDGRLLASAGAEGTVQLWDLSGRASTAWRGHEGLVPSQSSEGLYLPGYGYVFTLTMQAEINRPVHGPAKPGRKPLSQWEQVRNELHGVKAKPDDAQAAPE